MGTIFVSTKNSRKNERHKFVLNLSQRLNLKSEDKLDGLQNISIYYRWRNIRM